MWISGCNQLIMSLRKFCFGFFDGFRTLGSFYYACQIGMLFCFFDRRNATLNLCSGIMTRENHFYTFIYYSLCSNLFILYEKSNFLREHYLLSYLPYKNVKVYKITLK